MTLLKGMEYRKNSYPRFFMIILLLPRQINLQKLIINNRLHFSENNLTYCAVHFSCSQSKLHEFYLNTSLKTKIGIKKTYDNRRKIKTAWH